MFDIPREHSKDIELSVRLRDLSLQALTWGTEIPVVREKDCLTRPVTLFPIPTDDRFRQTLPVYDVDATGTGRVRVRIFASGLNAPSAPLAETELLLSAPNDNMFYTDWPYHPGIGEIQWISEAFPVVRGTGDLRIEIEPLTAGLRFWAFVSVTNNESQHVTLVTP